MENVYKKIVNTVPVFFFLWSRDQKETIFISEKFYNEKSKDYYAPQEPKEDLRQYIHPESQSEYDAFFENLTEENDYNDDIELRAGDSLPDIKWMKISTFPVVNQGDEIEYIAGHISDVTNSMEHSKLLEDQVRSLDTITFMLAHELTSPVTNMMGLSELLKSKAREAGVTQNLQLYDSIYNFGGEVLTLARGLVSLLDLQSGKEPFELEKVNLKDFVDALIANFYLKTSSKTIQLTAEQFDPDMSVQVNPVKFSRAIEEILVYMLKYTQAKGEIIISQAPGPNKEHLTIRITSHSISLSLKSIKRVLDRSSRLSMLDVKGQGVRGMLELVIAKEIIELHQGVLELLDGDEVQGFVISLPKKADSPITSLSG